MAKQYLISSRPEPADLYAEDCDEALQLAYNSLKRAADAGELSSQIVATIWLRGSAAESHVATLGHRPGDMGGVIVMERVGPLD